MPLPYGAPYCAKAATLKRVTAAAVSIASAFMARSFVMTTENVTDEIMPRLVLERHTENFN